MTVTGIRVSPAVLSTRNIIMAFEAVSFFGLSSWSSLMALSPRGVAALSSPSILAEKFINIEPSTGCPLGISGNILQKKGEVIRAKNSMTPPRSPIFIKPSQSVSTPVSPSEISKPVLALANIASITALRLLPSPEKRATASDTTTAMSTKAIQI